MKTPFRTNRRSLSDHECSGTGPGDRGDPVSGPHPATLPAVRGSATKAHSLAWSALMLLAAAATAGTVAWDGGGDGASWHDPLNWNTDTLPGGDDDVVIQVAASPTIRFTDTTGTVAVKSMNLSEAMVLSGGKLTVTTSATANAELTIETAGELAAASLEVTASGVLTLQDTALLAVSRIEVIAGRATLKAATAFDAVRIATGGSLAFEPVDAGMVMGISGNGTVEGGSTLSLGGASVLRVAGDLSVLGNSAVVVNSANRDGQVDDAWAGSAAPSRRPT